MLQRLAYLSFVSSVLCLELVPPPNIWVRENQNNVTLLCQASEKIRSCSWTTPYGEQYPLQPDLFAEGGRLMHFANNKDLECGILITNLQAKDSGRWKCNVGVVENSEVTTASGMANITIATPPSDVYLEEPFHQLHSNFSYGVNKVKCIARNSRPAPTFHWTVDQILLDHKTENMFDEENQFFAQIIHFTPTVAHGNKTLSCTVQHPGLDQNITASTEVKISSQHSVAMMGALGFGEALAIILGSIAFVIILGLAFVARKRYLEHNNDVKEPKDEEKGNNEEGGEKQENESEKKDVNVTDTKTDLTTEEKKGFEIKDKVVKILASLRPKEKKITEDIAASEFEKVELTEQEDEKKDEEKTTEEPKTTIGSKFASFLSKFKSSEKTEKEVIADSKAEVELDPENVEEESKVSEKRRGSETSV